MSKESMGWNFYLRLFSPNPTLTCRVFTDNLRGINLYFEMKPKLSGYPLLIELYNDPNIPNMDQINVVQCYC